MKKSDLKKIIREVINEQFNFPNMYFSLHNLDDAITFSQDPDIYPGFSGNGSVPDFVFDVCQLTAAPAGPITDPQSLGAGDGCFNYGISNPTTDELMSFLPLVDAEGYFPQGNNSCQAACIAPSPSEPEFQSIGDTEYDPDFSVGGSIEGGFQFPEGFDAGEWMNGWSVNLFQYMGLDMSGVCDFLSERISTWTNQYESAGPLYQNQLVFLPSNLTSLINSVAKKTASNLMKSLEQKTRMQKLANIPMDKPMDTIKPMNTIKPLDKPEEKGKI